MEEQRGEASGSLLRPPAQRVLPQADLFDVVVRAPQRGRSHRPAGQRDVRDRLPPSHLSRPWTLDGVADAPRDHSEQYEGCSERGCPKGSVCECGRSLSTAVTGAVAVASGLPSPWKVMSECRALTGFARNAVPIRDAEEIVAGFIEGVRVIEIGNELGEYCGKVLAGLGADVVRVEPPGGEVTRTYGPFYPHSPDPDRTLYFCHYNRGKRSVVIDLDSTEGCDDLIRLVGMSDVVIDSRPRGYLSQRGIDEEVLRAANPGLIWARITPFGDSGPWADYESSDLIQLALGGMMMNCGYDPDPSGFYETPPIAPQMWQSYHMAGEMTGFSPVTAFIYQLASA